MKLKRHLDAKVGSLAADLGLDANQAEVLFQWFDLHLVEMYQESYLSMEILKHTNVSIENIREHQNLRIGGELGRALITEGIALQEVQPQYNQNREKTLTQVIVFRK